jgi:hypothetical protein
LPNINQEPSKLDWRKHISQSMKLRVHRL